MLKLALIMLSIANFYISDYKHVVATSSIEIEPAFQTFEITAYTANYESFGKHPGHPLYGVTASGAYVKENHTIACGPELDFGTRIYIPHFNNEFECEDRGGAITEGKLDVYMPLVEDAREFGRRELKAIVR